MDGTPPPVKDRPLCRLQYQPLIIHNREHTTGQVLELLSIIDPNFGHSTWLRFPLVNTGCPLVTGHWLGLATDRLVR
jgi:hypothetical protein